MEEQEGGRGPKDGGALGCPADGRTTRTCRRMLLDGRQEYLIGLDWQGKTERKNWFRRLLLEGRRYINARLQGPDGTKPYLATDPDNCHSLFGRTSSAGGCEDCEDIGNKEVDGYWRR
jgi:hypothetical protein